MKKAIFAPDAPAAIGPYSHGISVGDLFFASGQIPLDPATGKLVGKSIDVQVHQVFANIKAVLHSAGLTLQNVVKTTVFLTDLADFKILNEIYATYFDSDPPARSCVQVAALPSGALVEIEVVAVTTA